MIFLLFITAVFADVDFSFYIISSDHGKCLTVNQDVHSFNRSNGSYVGNVHESICSNSNGFQKFNFHYENGTARFYSTPTGLSLDASRTNDLINNKNHLYHNIYVWGWHGRANQLWTLSGDNKDNRYTIKNLETLMCLDAARSSNLNADTNERYGNAYEHACHSGQNQVWRLCFTPSCIDRGRNCPEYDRYDHCGRRKWSRWEVNNNYHQCAQRVDDNHRRIESDRANLLERKKINSDLIADLGKKIASEKSELFSSEQALALKNEVVQKSNLLLKAYNAHLMSLSLFKSALQREEDLINSISDLYINTLSEYLSLGEESLMEALKSLELKIEKTEQDHYLINEIENLLEFSKIGKEYYPDEDLVDVVKLVIEDEELQNLLSYETAVFINSAYQSINNRTEFFESLLETVEIQKTNIDMKLNVEVNNNENIIEEVSSLKERVRNLKERIVINEKSLNSSKFVKLQLNEQLHTLDIAKHLFNRIKNQCYNTHGHCRKEEPVGRCRIGEY